MPRRTRLRGNRSWGVGPNPGILRFPPRPEAAASGDLVAGLRQACWAWLRALWVMLSRDPMEEDLCRLPGLPLTRGRDLRPGCPVTPEERDCSCCTRLRGSPPRRRLLGTA